MKASLKDSRAAGIRLLQPADQDLLFNYLQNLSSESLLFGPHPFDGAFVQAIFEQPGVSGAECRHQFVASFWNDEKDNHDMIKEL